LFDGIIRPAKQNPEQPSDTFQFGTGLLPIENGQLLVKSDYFQNEFVAWQEKRA
jgi:hypothetical protein